MIERDDAIEWALNAALALVVGFRIGLGWALFYITTYAVVFFFTKRESDRLPWYLTNWIGKLLQSFFSLLVSVLFSYAIELIIKIFASVAEKGRNITKGRSDNIPSGSGIDTFDDMRDGFAGALDTANAMVNEINQYLDVFGLNAVELCLSVYFLGQLIKLSLFMYSNYKNTQN
jgi:hypothetical protein